MELKKYFAGTFLNTLFRFNFGIKVFDSLAHPYYVQGNIVEVMEYIKKQEMQSGIHPIVNILGESANSASEAVDYNSWYNQIIEMTGKNNLSYLNISEKPTQLVVIDDSLKIIDSSNKQLVSALEQHVSKAESIGLESNKTIRITLDMEDHRFTDLSLNTAKQLWSNGLPLNIVLQSCLNRTEQDITDLFSKTNYSFADEKIGVRICRGIYLEPKAIATTDKKIAKKRLLARVEQLSNYGVYLQIATHDKEVVYEAINLLEKKNVPKKSYEIQGLMGVPNTALLAKELIAAGHNYATYFPFEMIQGASYPYLMRRLKANPNIMWYGIKNLFQTYRDERENNKRKLLKG